MKWPTSVITVLSNDSADCVTFTQGSISQLPFPNDNFDWLWSVDCAGYPASGSVGMMQELARVVRPGGKIALLGWSSQQLLPGHPMLEARLTADFSKYTPHYQGKPPSEHFMRAPEWFAAADLIDVTANTLVGEVQAPLSALVKEALVSLFEMLWNQPDSGLSESENLVFARLTDPGSESFILNRDDYYAFFTYTMFTGTVRSEV